ncbi:hypothetical protein A7982_13098 [Minicystis rosea]|nr:hypothetical protein A7982_13098 [Minicystis rosea]
MLVLGACSKAPVAAKRVEVRAVGPSSIELIPAAGLPPFCLVYTIAAKGIVRQLTPLDPNEAIPCPAGAPIGSTRYKIPPAEGNVRIHIVFSDRAIDGRPIAAQVRELGATPTFTGMDLRAPGNVLLETTTFSPAP